MIDRIVSYLSQSFSHTAVADMVNCDPSYVSQIAAAEEYRDLIEAEKTRLKAAKVDAELEEHYATLEKKVLKQVSETLPFAEFRDLTRTMEVLIRRKQQQGLHQQSSYVVNGNAQFNTVVLSIPRAAAPEITLNSQREVIAIGNKSLAPMQASSVRKLFDTLEAKKQQKVKDQQIEQIAYVMESTKPPEDF